MRKLITLSKIEDVESLAQEMREFAYSNPIDLRKSQKPDVRLYSNRVRFNDLFMSIVLTYDTESDAKPSLHLSLVGAEITDFHLNWVRVPNEITDVFVKAFLGDEAVENHERVKIQSIRYFEIPLKDKENAMV